MGHRHAVNSASRVASTLPRILVTSEKSTQCSRPSNQVPWLYSRSMRRRCPHPISHHVDFLRPAVDFRANETTSHHLNPIVILTDIVMHFFLLFDSGCQEIDWVPDGKAQACNWNDEKRKEGGISQNVRGLWFHEPGVVAGRFLFVAEIASRVGWGLTYDDEGFASFWLFLW